MSCGVYFNIRASTDTVALVWGEAGKRGQGYGLARIIARHSEVLDDLQGRLDRVTTVKNRSEHRIRLTRDTDDFIIRLDWGGGEKT